MRNDPRYIPTDVFETFPRPHSCEAVSTSAQFLDLHRADWMVSRDEGLTDTYNRLHDEADRTPEIVTLRELHVALDYAVRDAYGWNDLDFEHGFHPVRGQGVRYTFSPDAAVEVLYRLLELNRTRYEGEVASGLHDKKNSKASAKADDTAGTLF